MVEGGSCMWVGDTPGMGRDGGASGCSRRSAWAIPRYAEGCEETDAKAAGQKRHSRISSTS